MGPPGSSLSAHRLSTAPVLRYLTCCCCSLLLVVGVSSSPLVLYSSPSPLSRNVFLSSNMYLSYLSEKFSWWFLCSEQLFRRLEGGTEGVLEIRLPIQPFWRYGMQDWCISICFFSSSFVSFELHFVGVSSWVLDRLIESTALRASSILLHIFAEKDCFWPLFLYGLGLMPGCWKCWSELTWFIDFFSGDGGTYFRYIAEYWTQVLLLLLLLFSSVVAVVCLKSAITFGNRRK